MISAQVRGGKATPFFFSPLWPDVSPVVIGTSSKSTKLVHGGVRYLQKAVFELDYEQYKLVKEALHERKIFLQTAPYLSNMLPIMLPLYKCADADFLFFFTMN
jgi:glycerol-3-phosphate dehydrogenase